MPRIISEEIGIALDMCGCPNRCRHCWLGASPNRRMSEEDLRWAAAQFRGYIDGEFVLFMHTPGPDGKAQHIEHLRPTLDEALAIPNEVIESSQRHFDRDTLWHTEAELLARILEKPETFPYAYSPPDRLWLMIKNTWDVFANMGTLQPWWRLGNLRRDSISEIVGRFEDNRVPGLETIFARSPRDLVRRFGDARGMKIYSDEGDLLSLFVARYCKAQWDHEQGKAV